MDHHHLGNNVVGTILVIVLVFVAIFGIACVISPKIRKVALKPTYLCLGAIASIYLILRGIAEFWVINYSDPASYRSSWGGPSLIGVFAVHSGPGLIILIGLAVWLYKRAKKKRSPTINDSSS